MQKVLTLTPYLSPDGRRVVLSTPQGDLTILREDAEILWRQLRTLTRRGETRYALTTAVPVQGTDG